jgi:dolichol-phosphate mannosyltransferase
LSGASPSDQLATMMLATMPAEVSVPQVQQPSARPRTLVTVATYNEIENLPQLTLAVWQVAPQADILVIDDNSPDGTGRWCDERAASEPRLKCVHRAGKLGLGTATIAVRHRARV